MKNIVLVIWFLTITKFVQCQVNMMQGGILSQSYSKEITQYRVKEFIIREILQVPERKVIEVEINALTASKSGELTTVIYECKELKKRGLVFSFWNEHVNQYNLNYKGYAFRNFDFESAKILMDSLESVLDQKKAILAYDNNEDLAKNAIFKYEDLIFIFYKDETGSNLIRVIWNDFDSEWNQSNLKTMRRRFYKFFIPRK